MHSWGSQLWDRWMCPNKLVPPKSNGLLPGSRRSNPLEGDQKRCQGTNQSRRRGAPSGIKRCRASGHRATAQQRHSCCFNINLPLISRIPSSWVFESPSFGRVPIFFGFLNPHPLAAPALHRTRRSRQRPRPVVPKRGPPRRTRIR